MFEFKKSKLYMDGYEALRTSKFSNDFREVYLVKSDIDKMWKVKAFLKTVFFDEVEIVKETQWIKFKTKKIAVKHSNEFFWNY